MRPVHVAAALLILAACRHAAPDASRLRVPMVTDEADAVLAILEAGR